MVSIQKYGFNDPIGVWGDKNLIVEGHGRLAAAKKLHMTDVPVIRLDHLTEEQRKEYALIHNKTAELSEWDFDLLSEDVPTLDFSDFDIDWNLPELD
jgi:ParB-like chromosome segregation protein Spo0J